MSAHFLRTGIGPQHLTLWMLVATATCLSSCRAAKTPPPIIPQGDVSIAEERIVVDDMAKLQEVTSQLQMPTFLLDRMTDEFRAATLNNSRTPGQLYCPQLDFQNCVSLPKGSQSSSSGGAEPQTPMAPPGTTSYPVTLMHLNRRAVIDRWYADPNAPAGPLSIIASADGDVSAEQELVVRSDNPVVGPQAKTLLYTIQYRHSDMRIISFDVPQWFFYAENPTQIDVSGLVPELKRQDAPKPFDRMIGDYTVIDPSTDAFAYLVASQKPDPGTLSVAPDESLRQKASAITQVAIVLRHAPWTNIGPPGEAWHTTEMWKADDGIHLQLHTALSFPNGENFVIAGFERKTFVNMLTTIPMTQEAFDSWQAKQDDMRFCHNVWLTAYLCGTIIPGAGGPGTIIVAPEHLVATLQQEVLYPDSELASHPDVHLVGPEETIEDRDANALVTSVLADYTMKHTLAPAHNLWPVNRSQSQAPTFWKFH